MLLEQTIDLGQVLEIVAIALGGAAVYFRLDKRLSLLEQNQKNHFKTTSKQYEELSEAVKENRENQIQFFDFLKNGK